MRFVDCVEARDIDQQAGAERVLLATPDQLEQVALERTPVAEAGQCVAVGLVAKVAHPIAEARQYAL